MALTCVTSEVINIMNVTVFTILVMIIF